MAGEGGSSNGNGTTMRWIVGLLMMVLLALVGNLISGVQWGTSLSSDVRNLIRRVEEISTDQKTLDIKFQRLDREFYALSRQKGDTRDSDNR